MHSCGLAQRARCGAPPNAAEGRGALPPRLLHLAREEAPGVFSRLRAEELEADPALGDGRIDLEIGSIDHTDPETQIEELATLRMMAGVRPDPRRSDPRPGTAGRRRTRHRQPTRPVHRPLDHALAEQNLHRRVTATLPSHLAAMTLAAHSDLICLVPASLPGHPHHP
jgi:hypothetical protein